MKQKTFIPQITNVEILNYPVKAGSGNWGIAADVLGERKRETIGLIQENMWRKASKAEKPLVAMQIAAHTFRKALLEQFNMDQKKVQSASELMYHLWDSTGREAKGVIEDILINDKKLFPDNEETEIDFEIHDGFAVGEYEGKEYVMMYPTKYEVLRHEMMQQNIENYIGHAVTQTGIIPTDIAITYGKITLVKELPQVLEWDAEKTIHQNLQIRPDMLNAMLKDAGYQNDMKFPTQKGGTVKAGFIIIGEDNKVTEFRMGPTPGREAEAEAFYKDFPKDGVRDVLNMYSDWKMKIYEERVSDVIVRKAPNDSDRWFINCKIDGEQQLSRQMTQRDAFLYRQLQDKDSYYSKNLISGFVVNYFKDAVIAGQERQQGIKR